MKLDYKPVVISFLMFAAVQIMVILLAMFAPARPSVPYGTLDLFLQIEFVFILCYAAGVLILYSRSKKNGISLTVSLLPAYLILLWYVFILPDMKRLIAVLPLGLLIIILILIQRRKKQ